MTIGTADLAVRDLGFQPCETYTFVCQLQDRVRLGPNVVEIEHRDLLFAAIDAGGSFSTL
jgi:hypothetical protein